MSSAICFNSDQSNILSSGNGLNQNIPQDQSERNSTSVWINRRLCYFQVQEIEENKSENNGKYGPGFVWPEI